MSREKFDISDRLKELVHGMSQREFAFKLEISPSTLWEYLKGRTPPSDFIVRVCEYCRVNERWLLIGEGPKYRDEGLSVIPKDAATYTSLLLALIEKLEYIYKEGSFEMRAKVRGIIEEAWDTVKKERERSSKKNKVG